MPFFSKTSQVAHAAHRSTVQLVPAFSYGGKAMAPRAENDGQRAGRRRRAVWGGAVFLLLLPLVAMQFSNEMNWDETDFIVFGTMLVVACGTYELAARATGSGAYRAGVGVAVASAFLLVWMNLAVGIIGSEDNPANLMYGAVLAVAVIGGAIGQFQPSAMARALGATALAQALVGVIALAARLGSTAPSFPQAIIVLTAFFAVLWLLSAYLFRKAARHR